MQEETRTEALTEHANNNSSLDEEEIEKRHQYQMFPTPDQKEAAKVITRLKV